jgi:hypothetical protein
VLYKLYTSSQNICPTLVDVDLDYRSILKYEGNKILDQ